MNPYRLNELYVFCLEMECVSRLAVCLDFAMIESDITSYNDVLG